MVVGAHGWSLRRFHAVTSMHTSEVCSVRRSFSRPLPLPAFQIARCRQPHSLTRSPKSPCQDVCYLRTTVIGSRRGYRRSPCRASKLCVDRYVGIPQLRAGHGCRLSKPLSRAQARDRIRRTVASNTRRASLTPLPKSVAALRQRSRTASVNTTSSPGIEAAWHCTSAAR